MIIVREFVSRLSLKETLANGNKVNHSISSITDILDYHILSEPFPAGKVKEV